MTGAGSHVGGGPRGGLPYCSGVFIGAIHSRGNIARWIGMALRTESVIPSRRQVEKLNIVPGAKSEATRFRPKNERPSSTIAHVIRAHISLVYAFRIVKHSSRSRMRYLQELFVIVTVVTEDCPQ